MNILTKIFNLKTQKEFEIIKITDKIKNFVKESKIKQGFINIYSKHTTLAIKINEYEKLLLNDFFSLMKDIAEENKDYHHDKTELRENCPADEPKNAKSHLRCFLLETSQTIPILNYEMQLGIYQDIFAVETSGPRKREIILQVCGDCSE